MLHDPIETMIEKLRKRLEVAETVKAAISECPELRDELIAALTGQNGDIPLPLSRPTPLAKPALPPAPVRSHRAPQQHVRPTHFELIRKSFTDTSNQWASTSEIAARTNLKRESVSRVLYDSHKDKFENKPRPDAGDTNMKDWRLRQSAFAGSQEM